MYFGGLIMETCKIRKEIQDYVTWRKAQNVFKIGKLDDGTRQSCKGLHFEFVK